MRAQFAVIETLASLLLLSCAVTIAANSAYTTLKIQSDYNQGYGNAVYDFSELVSRNASAAECIGSDRIQCRQLLLSALVKAYGLQYARLSGQNASASYGSNALCTRSDSLCYPALSGVSYSVSCLYICGG